jgi:hypothetical protein
VPFFYQFRGVWQTVLPHFQEVRMGVA